MLRNPDLTLPLYTLVILAGFLLTKRFDQFVQAVHDAGSAV